METGSGGGLGGKVDKDDAVATDVAVPELLEVLKALGLKLGEVVLVVEVGVGEVGAEHGFFGSSGKADVVAWQVAVGYGFDELDPCDGVEVQVAMPVVSFDGDAAAVDFGVLDALGVVLADDRAAAHDPEHPVVLGEFVEEFQRDVHRLAPGGWRWCGVIVRFWGGVCQGWGLRTGRGDRGHWP